jgi:hypothetical protein
MASRVKGIEIEGLAELQKALSGLPKELEANVVRTIARKPGNKIITLARRLFTPYDTGITKRTFGILKVTDLKQRFIELGIKGRSLAWIFMSGAFGRVKKSNGASTGDIKPIGNVIEQAAAQMASAATKEMTVDLNKVIVKFLKRHLR